MGKYSFILVAPACVTFLERFIAAKRGVRTSLKKIRVVSERLKKGHYKSRRGTTKGEKADEISIMEK